MPTLEECQQFESSRQPLSDLDIQRIANRVVDQLLKAFAAPRLRRIVDGAPEFDDAYGWTCKRIKKLSPSLMYLSYLKKRMYTSFHANRIWDALAEDPRFVVRGKAVQFQVMIDATDYDLPRVPKQIP